MSKDPKSEVVWQPVKKVVYTIFVSNNHDFTCGEGIICSNIQSSKNIMTILVASFHLL